MLLLLLLRMLLLLLLLMLLPCAVHAGVRPVERELVVLTPLDQWGERGPTVTGCDSADDSVEPPRMTAPKLGAVNL